MQNYKLPKKKLTETPTPSCGGFDFCVTYRPDKCNYCECGVTDSGKPYEKCTSTYINSYYCNLNSLYFDGVCTSCEDGYVVNDAGECEGCVCPAIYKPVCCDGVTYANECVAGCNGQSCTGEITEGECEDVVTTETPTPSCGGIDYCTRYFYIAIISKNSIILISREITNISNRKHPKIHA